VQVKSGTLLMFRFIK